jgi:hypothetical protein
MERSVSPEAGHRALLAAAADVTGLVFDDDGYDDDVALAFIKEETASPTTDDDRPFRMPLKFKAANPAHKASGTSAAKTGTAQQGSRAGRHGKGAASKAGPKAAQSPDQPIIPRKIEDWDPWKAILHELYITQNRILRDIIGIMETKHNLRAT